LLDPDKEKMEDGRDTYVHGLESLVASTMPLVGEEFFAEFVRRLAETYGAQFAIVNELIESDPVAVRSLAFWQNGQLGENIEYKVKTTPCESVYSDGLKYFPANIQSLFPDDEDLVRMGVHSYFGAPMISNSGEIIGHICILGEKPLAETKKAESYFNIFVTRAAAELERLKLEREIIHHRDKLKELVDEKMASLRHAKESAEAANQVKTEFLARMTFELKIPANSILGYAELLKEGNDSMSAEQQGFVDNIISAGWLLDNIINDVLDISLVETGELFINHTRCRVTECVNESIKMIECQAKEKSIRVVCLYDTDADACIVADKKRLKQIFTNLLSNAVKFNRDNSVVKVKITPVGKNKIRISIIDRGIGIAEEDQHKIFEKFERLDAEERWIGGTGIGLAITKRLVEHMGGCIGVDSVLGVGSTFWVEFAST